MRLQIGFRCHYAVEVVRHGLRRLSHGGRFVDAGYFADPAVRSIQPLDGLLQADLALSYVRAQAEIDFRHARPQFSFQLRPLYFAVCELTSVRAAGALANPKPLAVGEAGRVSAGRHRSMRRIWD